MLGLIFGSAGNALIDRLPRKESWFKGRSKCDKCGHELGFWDLIPVVSYLWLKGKCRYCHFPIPIRNLIVELVIGMGFVLLQNPLLCGIFWVTVIVAVMDFETQLVSDVMIMIWGILVLVLNSPLIPLLNSRGGNLAGGGVLGVVVAVGIIGGIAFFSKERAMGWGDVEIAVVMGWWLGWPKILPGLWMAFVLGGIWGAILLLRQKAKMQTKMAFGPWLVLGSWIGVLWGDMIIGWIGFQF